MLHSRTQSRTRSPIWRSLLAPWLNMKWNLPSSWARFDRTDWTSIFNLINVNFLWPWFYRALNLRALKQWFSNLFAVCFMRALSVRAHAHSCLYGVVISTYWRRAKHETSGSPKQIWHFWKHFCLLHNKYAVYIMHAHAWKRCKLCQKKINNKMLPVTGANSPPPLHRLAFNVMVMGSCFQPCQFALLSPLTTKKTDHAKESKTKQNLKSSASIQLPIIVNALNFPQSDFQYFSSPSLWFYSCLLLGNISSFMFTAIQAKQSITDRAISKRSNNIF